MSETVNLVDKARVVGAPIIAITTPDQQATIDSIMAHDKLTTYTAQGGDETDAAAYTWDIVDGLVGLNAASDADTAWREGLDPVGTVGEAGLIEVLRMARKATGGIYFVLNAHRVLAPESGQGVNAAISQAICNVRDEFKATSQTLILLAPAIDLPPELQGNVLVIDEALPTADALGVIVRQIHEAAGLDLDDDAAVRCVDALLGLPAFAAEQALALSLRRGGVDVDRLWERKRQMVEQTPGLAVYRGTDTLDDLRGIDNIASFVRLIFNGGNPPKAVVFLDEIEKALAGSTGGGESSGTSADQLGVILSYMEDNEARGLMFVGPPGAAKSAVAKAAGNTGGVPTIQMDLGAAKGSLVGQSEAQIRAMLKVVTAVSGGSPLFVATSNNIANLPPELKRRFTMGTFFFDLPTDHERRTIWDLYLDRYGNQTSGAAGAPASAGLGLETDFDDDGWTGAEVKACAKNAADLGISLVAAAAYIVPVAKSDADRIERLRTEANGKYIGASVPGPYRAPSKVAAPTARRIGRGLDD